MSKISEKIGAVFKRRSRQYDLEEYLKRQQKRGYTGALQAVSEIPMAPPVGYKKRDSIFDIVHAQVTAQLSQQAAAQQKESFEEFEDFEIPDDPIDRSSPYENDFDPKMRDLILEGLRLLREKKANPAARTAPEPLEKGADAPKPKAGTPLEDDE